MVCIGKHDLALAVHAQRAVACVWLAGDGRAAAMDEDDDVPSPRTLRAAAEQLAQYTSEEVAAGAEPMSGARFADLYSEVRSRCCLALPFSALSGTPCAVEGVCKGVPREEASVADAAHALLVSLGTPCTGKTDVSKYGCRWGPATRRQMQSQIALPAGSPAGEAQSPPRPRCMKAAPSPQVLVDMVLRTTPLHGSRT